MRSSFYPPLLFLILALLVPTSRAREPQTSPSSAQQTVRARALGIPFDGTPGPLNAITDVAGVTVGYSTIIRGEGKLEVGKGPVRTGVTAVLPRGDKSFDDAVYAGVFSLNGNGEMTGTAWIEEGGFLEGPLMITNTHSVGVVRDAVIQWRVSKGGPDPTGFSWSLPVVAETYDGYLNDINGFHVKPEHAVEALEKAKGGPVAEGSVGGGTGMMCFEFKGGMGTASRVVKSKGPEGAASQSYTVGAIVQSNFGLRPQLMITGVPVGKEIPEGAIRKQESGSIIVAIATDAPLLPHQLKRLARRASHGLARTGGTSGNGSGDLFIAFSTANAGAASPEKPAQTVQTIPNDRLDGILNATVHAVEEAIINSIVANESMTGAENRKVIALPHDRVRDALKKYGRLQ